MSKIIVKANQLTKPNCQYISLVKRGANRIPFRVLKEDKEDKNMSIDLTRLFKQDEPKVLGPLIVGIALASSVAKEEVETLIKAAGFSTKESTPQEDGSVIFKQEGFSTEGVTPLNIEGTVCLLVKGCTLETGSVFKAEGGLVALTNESLLSAYTEALVSKSGDELVESLKVISDHVCEVSKNIPGVVFKLVQDIQAVQKAANKKPEEDTVGTTDVEGLKGVNPPVDESNKDKKPAETPVDKEGDGAEKEGKTTDTEDTPKEVISKEDIAKMETSLVSIAESLGVLSNKISAMDTVLEGVVVKVDTTDALVKSKLIGGTPHEDTPPKLIVKTDTVTPITDTAYMPKKHSKR